MATLVRKPTGVYYLVSSVNGKRVWKSTGTKDRRLARHALGTAEVPTEHRQSPTLSAAIEEYIAHVKGSFRSKTHEVYELALGHFLSHVGDVPVEAVNLRQVEQFKATRLGRVSLSTVNIELRALRTFFNRLAKWEVVAKNPTEGVSLAQLPQRTPAYLTKDQLAALAAGMENPWLRPIVLFAAMTGARLGEILNLTWDRVDLEKKVVLIESNLVFRTKCGKIRAIPLNTTACQILAEMGPREGLVFKGKRGGRANPNKVSAGFRAEVRRLGLDPRLHFHSLRHSFASLLVQQGVSLFQVQQLLGHSSSRVTEIYAHLQNPQLHHVVDLLNQGC